ncbi:head-tail adaptor protein [Halodurantibacterium flavum]|uniref:Head-tail adaptor protein n=1 Tax=Halodurantibacterium flavum TaxID=1382802 RepID=A0ABW4S3J2_9RHOB
MTRRGIAPVLRQALVLEEVSASPDGAGGYREEWVTLGTLYAEVIAGTGRERTADLVTLSMVPWRITVRGAPVGASERPRPGQRFRQGPRRFRILSVAERDAAGRYLLCLAHEEVAL